MIKEVMGPEATRVMAAAQRGGERTVDLMGEKKSVQYPFPSPGDWRDCSIYFLMLDRFNNPSAAPRSRWDGTYGFRQGQTFERGSGAYPGYCRPGSQGHMAITAIEEPGPPEWQYNYHGYAIQDFLSVDGTIWVRGGLAKPGDHSPCLWCGT